MSIELVFDFREDIRAEYADRLSAAGFPVKSTDSLEDILVRFFSLSARRIDAVPRLVAWSAELRSRVLQLPKNYQESIGKIERLSESGGDLNPYQSRDLARKPWRSDPQLLEWGITHFHLGLGPDPKHGGMIAGTPDLLFVIVTASTLYLVEVLPHNSFSDQSVFDLAIKNWPDPFEHAALEGAVGLERNVASDERKALRAANVNVLTMGGDGRVYGPVGGGVTTSGASLQVVTQHVHPRMGPITQWQRLCEKTPERVLGLIPERARAGLSTIELHATEALDGVITFSAVNLIGGAMALGSGYPPDE